MGRFEFVLRTRWENRTALNQRGFVKLGAGRKTVAPLLFPAQGHEVDERRGYAGKEAIMLTQGPHAQDLLE